MSVKSVSRAAYPVYMENVSFKSAQKFILNKISNIIHENEKILLLGPNGSGKSTLLKILSGLFRPSGAISIFGHSSYSRRAKELRRFVPQALDFPPMLKVKELLTFVQCHYKDKTAPKAIFEKYDINPNKYAAHLSDGQKRRLSLALALLGNPALLLLDEPETGLDIMFRETVLNEIILKSDKRKVAMVMATHFFASAIQYFDRVLIIANGNITYDASRENFLKSKDVISRFDIEAECPQSVIDAHINKKFRYMRVGEKDIRLYLEHDKQSIHALQKANWPGKCIQAQPVTVEDIYFYHVGE